MSISSQQNWQVLRGHRARLPQHQIPEPDLRLIRQRHVKTVLAVPLPPGRLDVLNAHPWITGSIPLVLQQFANHGRAEPVASADGHRRPPEKTLVSVEVGVVLPLDGVGAGEGLVVAGAAVAPFEVTGEGAAFVDPEVCVA